MTHPFKNVGSSIPEQCQSGNSVFFVQFACVHTAEDLVTKQVYSLILACIVVFIALTMFNFFEYMQKEQEIEEVIADVNTLTPADYTVYININ